MLEREKLSDDLAKYLARRRLSDTEERKAFQRYSILVYKGWKTLEIMYMWLYKDAPNGNRLFAACFVEPGSVKLIWRDPPSQPDQAFCTQEIADLSAQNIFS